jgi:hypothetical protein
MRDETAQTDPLTIGQRLIADYEADVIAQPWELAKAIDAAIAGEREACAKVCEIAANALIEHAVGMIDNSEAIAEIQPDQVVKSWHGLASAIRARPPSPAPVKEGADNDG